MSQESLPALLRRLRSSADLTLEELSELSAVSVRTISDVERGVSLRPQRRTVELLADALRLDDDGRQSLLAARSGRTPTPAARQGGSPVPRGVDDFAGRRREVDVLTAHLALAAPDRSCPVVVISGPPGFGKTSLAVKVAAQSAALFDETYFVDLRGYDARPVGPLAVLNRLVHALEPQAGAVPGDLEDAAALWRSKLLDRRVLIVLDNAASEEQVRAAIPATGPAAVVVTTRGALAGLEDVVRVSLDQLSATDSVALLRRIVPAAQQQGQDLARLAELCGHVPLALRIAGNRLMSRQTWTVDDLAGRLAVEDRRVDALRAGDLQIRAAIALSYDRLSARGRQGFRRLAHLRGSTFGDAVAARLMPADLDEAEDVLDELVDLGLVQPATHGRYQLHDLLRLFARGRLHEKESAGDRAAAETDLRRWLLHVTILAGRWHEPGYESAPPVPDALVPLETADRAEAWLRDESEHWLLALQDSFAVGEHRLVVDVAESLHWFAGTWAHWGHWHEVFALGVAAARALEDDAALAAQLGYLSYTEVLTRLDHARGLEHALEAGRVARRAGNTRQEGWAASYANRAYAQLGRLDESLLSAAEAARLFASAGDVEGHLQALQGTAGVMRLLDRPEEAIDQGLVVLGMLDDPTLVVSPRVAALTRIYCLDSMSAALAMLRRWAETVEVASSALALLDETFVVLPLTRLLERRARALAALGRTDEALDDRARLLEVCDSIGDVAGAERAREMLTTPESTG